MIKVRAHVTSDVPCPLNPIPALRMICPLHIILRQRTGGDAVAYRTAWKWPVCALSSAWLRRLSEALGQRSECSDNEMTQ